MKHSHSQGVPSPPVMVWNLPGSSIVSWHLECDHTWCIPPLCKGITIDITRSDLAHIFSASVSHLGSWSLQCFLYFGWGLSPPWNSTLETGIRAPLPKSLHIYFSFLLSLFHQYGEPKLEKRRVYALLVSPKHYIWTSNPLCSSLSGRSLFLLPEQTRSVL